MRRIDVKAPQGCIVVGFLYDEPNVRCRGEDMVEIVLPDGSTIDAGWYPEGSPQGRYRLALHSGMVPIVPPISIDDIDELAAEIEDLSHRYVRDGAPGINFSSAQSELRP